MQSVTPKKVKVIKVVNGKNSLKVKWEKDNTKYGTSNHVDGYQIGYDRKGYKFQFGQAGPQNTVMVKGYKKTKKIIKNVKKPRKYAVAVRSYKTVDEQTIYGPWSVVYY